MTLLRKSGLASCMLLALLGAMPVGLSTPAYAQPVTPPVPAVPSVNIGTQIATAIQNGVDTSTIVGGLALTPGLGNVTELAGIIDGLRNNAASPAAIAAVINGVAAGSLPPSAAAAIAAVAGLESITDPLSLLTNPAVQAALEALPGGLAGLFNSATDLTGLLGLGTSFLNPIIAAQAAAALAAAFPDIATLLGGAAGIAAALQSGGLIAAIAAAGGLPSTADVLPTVMTSGQNPISTESCSGPCVACEICHVEIPRHYSEVRINIQGEFLQHRTWLINTFWMENMLPAMMLMADQLTAVGIMQIQMIGAMLDAKHQLETQRLFQTMTAQAHKDYHPSEGMCTFGTTVRSLAGSDRRTVLAQLVYAQRMNARQALGGGVLSVEGLDSDKRSRLDQFITTYCDPADNANGLGTLCPNPGEAARRNIDVDYTRNVESRLTLDIHHTDPVQVLSDDEEDLFALSANLFANTVPPQIAQELLASVDGRIRQSAVEKYMDLRAIFAKRSVAQNSFAAITAQRVRGSPESAPYTKALIRELGVDSAEDINLLLGEEPSYFAQMEVLTKKIYQNPMFYTELYDKPANIARKGAAIQAIGLMQDRDLYNSLIRSEVVLSVLLETMLQKEQDKVANEGPKRNPAGGSR